MKRYEMIADEENVDRSIKDDSVGNQKYLCSILKLLSNIDDNQIICIDGDWGVGKTFLVKQLEYILKKYKDEYYQSRYKILESDREIILKLCDSYYTFYYNAWKNDDHDDPFSSIIYNILNEYPQYKDEITSKFDKEEFLKELLNIVTKILSNNLLKADITAEKIDKIKTFNDLTKEITTIEEKKALFKKLIDLILENKRMLLIIDELDRCNPRFATKLLEVVKHFYDLQNVTVIVVSNNRELQSTIKQQYGQSFDAYSYLNRFFDFTYRIENDRSILYAQNYLKFGLERNLPHYTFFAMIEKYNYSFRDCNRYKVLYDMAISIIEGSNQYTFYLNKKEYMSIQYIIIPIVLALKIKDYEAYNQCLEGKTELLKEAIMYLDDFLCKNNLDGWLREFIETNNTIVSKTTIANEIAKAFEKLYDLDGMNQWFLDIIKTNI